MKNHFNEIMRIDVNSCRFENTSNKFHICEPLNAELVIINESGQFNAKLWFPPAPELERIQIWLTEILNGNLSNKELNFKDHKLKLKLMKRSNKAVIKVIYTISETNREVWELLPDKSNVPEFIQELKNSLLKYPSRCNQTNELQK